MKWILSLFLCLTASAQLPVIPYVIPSGSKDPIGVPGLYELWVFTDLVTNNMPITNWIGEISNTILTNGAATQQPTNSANGVMFGQNSGLQYLTNLPINLGSNFTVVVRGKMTSEGFAPSGVYPMWSEFKTSWIVGWGDGTIPKATFGWYDHATVNHTTAGLNAIQGTYIDHMMVNSNNANGTGKTYPYTNAVLVAGSFAAEPNTTKFSGVAWGGSPNWATTDAYRGLIEIIEVYTNVLTPTQLTTVFTYNSTRFP